MECLQVASCFPLHQTSGLLVLKLFDSFFLRIILPTLLHINLRSSSICRCFLLCGSAVTLMNSYLAFRLVINLLDILDFITLCFSVIHCLIK